MQRLLLLFLISSSFLFANPKKPSNSAIKAVTVFVNGAQVTRTAKVNLPIGSSEFQLDKLSPYIDESSIQISGLSGASVLSINYAINHISKLDNTENIEAFQNEIEALNDAIQKEENLMEGYQEEIKLIEENRRLGNTNKVVDLEKLKRFAAYYRMRITELINLISLSVKKKRNLKEEIETIRKQLTELNVDDKIQTGEIKLKLSSNSPKQLNLIIKYNVSNAGWFPIYDLKAQSIKKPLELNYKAHVYQTTGIPWNNIKLTLSTNDPNTNNLKPEINSKYLNFVSRYSNYKSEHASKRYDYKYNPFIKRISGTITDGSGMPLPGANVALKGTSTGTVTDFDGHFSIDAIGAKELEVSYVGYTTAVIPIHSSIINLSLQEDVAHLDEVVITGYATTKKSSISSSVSKINIRGNSTIDNSSPPLYVINGTPTSESDYNNIHPDMIADIEVLKGASARNIYGNRASNGVIVVTTKKGSMTSNGDLVLEGINNTNFEIQKLSTIISDGDITVIEIDNFKVPANFSYFTAPVLNENVFLTAKINDWQQYNLLPGEVNVYFEDSYSGVTNINPYTTADSLTVSLGIDPNVVVTRKPVNNFKKTNFIGSNRIIERAYDIAIKNNKTSAIDIIIYDRIPISQNKEIKVDDIETGNANYDTKKGILKWKATISPKDYNKYQFAYSVKYPKYKKVNL